MRRGGERRRSRRDGGGERVWVDPDPRHRRWSLLVVSENWRDSVAPALFVWHRSCGEGEGEGKKEKKFRRLLEGLSAASAGRTVGVTPKTVELPLVFSHEVVERISPLVLHGYNGDSAPAFAGSTTQGVVTPLAESVSVRVLLVFCHDTTAAGESAYAFEKRVASLGDAPVQRRSCGHTSGLDDSGVATSVQHIG